MLYVQYVVCVVCAILSSKYKRLYVVCAMCMCVCVSSSFYVFCLVEGRLGD